MSAVTATIGLLSIALWSRVQKCCGLTMLTQHHVVVLDVGDSTVLECSFRSPRYNMFDYPVIWRKQQLTEWTQVNVMGSVNEPFVSSSNRFDLSFTATPPYYLIQLSIQDVLAEDSGNYTCEIRGPLSMTLAHVTHQLYIRQPVSSLVFLNSNSSTSAPVEQQMSVNAIRMVESQPRPLRCVAVGGYPPPTVSLYVGGRDVSAEFNFSRSVALTRSGAPGLRRMSVRSERWKNELDVGADDDDTLMKCVATVPGLKSTVQLIRLHVDFGPKISCWSTEAAVGQRDVTLTCTLVAQPSLTSLFWIIAANGTTLTDSDTDNAQFRARLHSDVDGRTVAQLQIRQVREADFHVYTIVAENRVSVAAKDIPLVHKTDVPLADSSAAASHVAQREISRESRLRQTDSYSYVYSSSRSACTSHHVLEPARTWLRLASIAAVVRYSSQLAPSSSR